MLERIIIAIIILGTLFLLLKLARVKQLRQAQHLASTLSTQDKSQVLYFSSNACSQCLGQEKILNEILENAEFMHIVLNKYSIEDQNALAKKWGVKTLPTTILLSKAGEVKKINNGLVSSNTIRLQLRELNI